MAAAGYAPSYSWVGPPTPFNGSNLVTGGDSCTSSLSYRPFTLSSNESTTVMGEVILAMAWLTWGLPLQRSRTSINGMPPETKPTSS